MERQKVLGWQGVAPQETVGFRDEKKHEKPGALRGFTCLLLRQGAIGTPKGLGEMGGQKCLIASPRRPDLS